MTEKDLPAEPTSDISSQNQTKKTDRPISGFWRRLVAYLLDTLLLGVVGFLFGTVFAKQLIPMAWEGHIIGLAIFAGYFGIMQSHIASGQSIGKKMLNIRVVGRDGQILSLGRSLGRGLILGMPLVLNGIMLPQEPGFQTIGYIISSFFFCGFVGLAYFYIFNRRTRQSLHDLICGTYVVKAKAEGPVRVGPVARIHYVVAPVLAGLLLLVPYYIVSNTVRDLFGSQELRSAQQRLADMEEVRIAMVTDFPGAARQIKGRPVGVMVVLDDEPPSFEAEADRVAKALMEAYPDAMSAGNVMVSLMYGWNIGIAYNMWTYLDARSPEEWLDGTKKKGTSGTLNSTVSVWRFFKFNMPSSS